MDMKHLLEDVAEVGLGAIKGNKNAGEIAEDVAEEVVEELTGSTNSIWSKVITAVRSLLKIFLS